MTRPGSQEPLGLTQLYFSAGVGFPYVLRVFAQEIVPRPDSGSAFVCKSHVRLCVASPVPVSIMLITSARKLPVGGRCSLKKKFSTLGACLWVRVAVASQSGERRGSKNADLATPKLGPPGGPNFGVAVPAFSCIYTL